MYVGLTWKRNSFETQSVHFLALHAAVSLQSKNLNARRILIIELSGFLMLTPTFCLTKFAKTFCDVVRNSHSPKHIVPDVSYISGNRFCPNMIDRAENTWLWREISIAPH